MRRGKEVLTVGLTIVITSALLVACTPSVFALPTADNFGVADNSGDKGAYVVVPVDIANVQGGQTIGIMFDIHYNHGVIEVVEVQNGNLTTFWDNPSSNNTFAWGTRVSLVYDGQTTHALQNGATGSVVLLNFSVIGEPCETSRMNLTNIQLADMGYNVGTASAKNGIFSIRTSPEPTPIPTLTPSATPPASPSVSLSPTLIPSPSSTPAPKQPSFEALVAIVGLVAAAYLLNRRKVLP